MAKNNHPNQLNAVYQHGLFIQIEKYNIDGKSSLGHAIRRVTEALADLFPQGPTKAAQILIQRMVYKVMRLELFENWDYATGEATPPVMANYIQISNSLRKDLTTLMSMAKGQETPSNDPDLKEYLDTMKRVAKAEGGRVPLVRIPQR